MVLKMLPNMRITIEMGTAGVNQEVMSAEQCSQVSRSAIAAAQAARAAVQAYA